MLKIIELFSGIGSQTQALKNLGIEHEVVAISEIDKYAVQSYEAMHCKANNLGDITKIQELPKADLWTYSFPCFTADTLVLTDIGYKKIVDIAVGDMVLTHMNRHKEVVATMNQGTKSILKISAIGIDEIKCTPNHRFYVRHFNGVNFDKPIWKEARLLTQSDYLGTFQKGNYDNAFYEDGYIWFSIRKIEEFGTAPVYDISVAEDESFTANGVIVHNCQDISVAGKGAGIKEGTRSGLLFEVERLLRVAEQTDTLPKYLLLENVKNLIGKKFRADFDSWLLFLSSLGYTNYWQVLNAKHYGIPQHRERVFCVSIRGATREADLPSGQSVAKAGSKLCLRPGEHTPFIFPEKQELTLRLRDMIDEIVDDRYYLKESTIRSIMHSTFNQRRDSIRPRDGVANTLCSRDWRGPQCVQVGELVGDKYERMHDISRRVYSQEGLSPTLTQFLGGNTEVKIVAMRGRNPDNPSDRTASSPTEQRLEPNSQGLCNALTTVQKDNLVMENAYVARRYGEFIEDKGYLPEMFVAYNKTEVSDVAPTLTVQCASFGGSSAVLKLETPLKVRSATKQGYEVAEEGDYINTSYPTSNVKRGRVGKGISHAICAGDKQAVVTENVRIRKLTPRECLRLILRYRSVAFVRLRLSRLRGWNDEQIDKIQAAKVSGTQQYRQAGNGIVVQVLMAIFERLFLC